jgi:hypothetical protein
MISSATLTAIKSATCAVGYLKPAKTGEPLGPNFSVFGTGFVVRPGTVLTSRRVMTGLKAKVDIEKVPAETCRLLFNAESSAGLTTYLCNLMHYGWASKKTENVGVFDYIPPSDNLERQVTPVTFPEAVVVRVGQRVGVLGYAFPEAAVDAAHDGGKPHMYRIGPFLQQGSISALAPHEVSRQIDRILLDVQSSSAMRGAPVIDLASGAVLALHYDIIGGVVGVALPLSAPWVRALLDAHDAGRQP